MDWGELFTSTQPINREVAREAALELYRLQGFPAPAVVFVESPADFITKVCQIDKTQHTYIAEDHSFQISVPLLGISKTLSSRARVRGSYGSHNFMMSSAAPLNIPRGEDTHLRWQAPSGTEYPPKADELMSILVAHQANWGRYSEEFPKGWKVMREKELTEWNHVRTSFIGWTIFANAPSAYRAHASQMNYRKMASDELTLCENSFVTHPTRYFMYIMERPAELHFNNNGRLSNFPGPAVKFRDGSGIYVANGVIYPRVSGDLTKEKILENANAEVRRVMMETYGIEKYLKDVRARLLDESEIGKLWSIPNHSSWRQDTYVQVKNSTPEPDGTYKDYFLHVPPGMSTARQAVAWTFNLQPNEYEPKAET